MALSMTLRQKIVLLTFGVLVIFAGTVGTSLATGILQPALAVASRQIGRHLAPLVPAGSQAPAVLNQRGMSRCRGREHPGRHEVSA